jgi:hypothetical protein
MRTRRCRTAGALRLAHFAGRPTCLVRDDRAGDTVADGSAPQARPALRTAVISRCKGPGQRRLIVAPTRTRAPC